MLYQTKKYQQVILRKWITSPLAAVRGWIGGSVSRSYPQFRGKKPSPLSPKRDDKAGTSMAGSYSFHTLDNHKQVRERGIDSPTEVRTFFKRNYLENGDNTGWSHEEQQEFVPALGTILRWV